MSRNITVLTVVLMLASWAAAVNAGSDATSAASSQDGKNASRVDDRNCLKETGWHVRTEDRKCTGSAGKGYNHDDLDHIGSVSNSGEALQRQDPSIQIQHH